MTLLDAAGKAVGEDDVQWMREMIFTWLRDAKVGNILIRERIFTGQQIAMIGLNLQTALRNDEPVAPASLRSVACRILQNRVARISIARLVLEREAQNRDEYEGVIDAFPRLMDDWSRRVLKVGEAGAGPRPELPEAPPDARDRHAVMKELQDLRTDLERVVDSPIVRPFG